MGILTVLICAQGYKGFCTVCITNPRITRQQVVSNRYIKDNQRLLHKLLFSELHFTCSGITYTFGMNILYSCYQQTKASIFQVSYSREESIKLLGTYIRMSWVLSGAKHMLYSQGIRCRSLFRNKHGLYLHVTAPQNRIFLGPNRYKKSVMVYL